MSTVVNLTPHPVTLYAPDTPDVVEDPAQGVVAVWPVAGPMARCAETRAEAGTITVTAPDGTRLTVPLAAVGFGAVTGLPAPVDGTLYVVSRATAERATGREDVVYPDRPVRSTSGQILGCRAVARAGQTA